MAQQDDTPEAFAHISAALKAAESVQPGNELQEAAAADILRLAFEQEVRLVFPDRNAAQA
jgi:hypothetical protein